MKKTKIVVVRNTTEVSDGDHSFKLYSTTNTGEPRSPRQSLDLYSRQLPDPFEVVFSPTPNGGMSYKATEHAVPSSWGRDEYGTWYLIPGSVEEASDAVYGYFGHLNDPHAVVPVTMYGETKEISCNQIVMSFATDTVFNIGEYDEDTVFTPITYFNMNPAYGPQRDRRLYNFNQYINNWDLSGYTSIAGMFYLAWNFNQDISSWDVSNVEDMTAVFLGARAFNQELSSWDMSNVTSTLQMFADALKFNKDISNWDVSKVTNMGLMFAATEDFNQDISQWDTSSVEIMHDMFNTAESFNQDISSWCVEKVIQKPLRFDRNGHPEFTNNASKQPNWGAPCQ